MGSLLPMIHGDEDIRVNTCVCVNDSCVITLVHVSCLQWKEGWRVETHARVAARAAVIAAADIQQ